MDFPPDVHSSLVDAFDLRASNCKWCGKHVNERFRFEFREKGNTWYEHLYCSLLHSDYLWENDERLGYASWMAQRR